MTGLRFLQVAVPCPLHRCFDYRVPAPEAVPEPGSRVVVPFGRRRLVGLVLGHTQTPQIAVSRIREIGVVLDPAPVVPAELRSLIEWTSRYYHQPIGECVATALPAP
ncbi:primosomal protein N', partial [Ectothiorhodospiraceae bacterium WFHF3C12]|nr:primosomal protein N' [Ectothiorhodospiraceae bacterium WFHF3C12]